MVAQRARPGLERKPAAAPEPTREEDKEEENQMEMDEPEPEENGEDRRREGAEEYVAGDNDADKADNDGSDAQAELQEEGLEDGGEPAVKVAGHVTTRLVQVVCSCHQWTLSPPFPPPTAEHGLPTKAHFCALDVLLVRVVAYESAVLFQYHGLGDPAFPWLTEKCLVPGQT